MCNRRRVTKIVISKRLVRKVSLPASWQVGYRPTAIASPKPRPHLHSKAVAYQGLWKASFQRGREVKPSFRHWTERLNNRQLKKAPLDSSSHPPIPNVVVFRPIGAPLLSRSSLQSILPTWWSGTWFSPSTVNIVHCAAPQADVDGHLICRQQSCKDLFGSYLQEAYQGLRFETAEGIVMHDGAPANVARTTQNGAH